MGGSYDQIWGEVILSQYLFSAAADQNPVTDRFSRYLQKSKFCCAM